MGTNNNGQDVGTLPIIITIAEILKITDDKIYDAITNQMKLTIYCEYIQLKNGKFNLRKLNKVF